VAPVENSTTAPESAIAGVIERLRESMPEGDARHPNFVDSVIADARVAAAFRGERHEFRSKLDALAQAFRLMLQTDAFFALVAYRMKARLLGLGIPVLPWIAHRLSMISAQISIEETVVVRPGVVIPNGQVVIEGDVEIGALVTLSPWVTIGPTRGGGAGPTLAPGVVVGTGAKLVGDIEIGTNSRIGLNAVVLDDVPPNTTVVGMPAEPIAD
jgi:serine O-acetyltransferase